MTTSVSVRSASFVEQPGMPHVHTDQRRTITERVDNIAGTNMIDRVTRIEVTGTQVPLGNHYHDFDEVFEGTGGGVLYTAPSTDPGDITRHDLPEAGWTVTIPAGVIHTFVVSKPAVLVSRTDRHFVSDANHHEYPDQPVNTHVTRLDV
jgi:hypothetical protein